jgi:hypothetical membrane protein
MSHLTRKVAGPLILVGAVQFIVGMVVAEALYSGYSVRNNTISALGVGPSAMVFNSSIILLGLMALVGAYFIWLPFRAKLVTTLIILAAVGAMGVGAFPSSTGLIHDFFSLMAFLFGGLSAIAAYKLEKAPLSYISVVLGIVSLVALVLYGSQNYLGLGRGGMERMVAYPIVLWAIGFGGHLIASETRKRNGLGDLHSTHHGEISRKSLFSSASKI